MKTKKSLLTAAVLSLLALALVAIPSLGFANEPPVANAGGNRNAYTGIAIVLNGSATDPEGDPIIAWQWVVDIAPAGAVYDLVPTNVATPNFVAFTPGDYVVGLVVEDSYALSAPDYVTIHVADNLPPVAVATADKTTVTVGDTVCFDGSQSYDPEGGPLSFIWNFGDGSPEQSGSSLCHSFSEVSTFSVTLTAIDERNAFDTDVVAITVNPPANHPPVASPTATPTSGDAPLPVQFTANATDADNDPLTFAWDFGDGATSTLANPAHTYAQAGTYVTWLTVSDGKDPVSYSLTITVSPNLAFSVASASVKWAKKSTLASVDVVAGFAAPVPAAGDTIMMTFDGITLFAVPFSSFGYDAATGAYSYQEKNTSVSIDFSAGTIGVHTTKTVMTGFDTANGVDVYLKIGALDAVENITMTAAKGDRLLYQR